MPRRSKRYRYNHAKGKVEQVGDTTKPRTRARWPLKNDAMGVSADQIPEARQKFADAGVPMDYTPDGRAIITDPKHYRDACKVAGLYARNGGYSDPPPHNI